MTIRIYYHQLYTTSIWQLKRTDFFRFFVFFFWGGGVVAFKAQGNIATLHSCFCQLEHSSAELSEDLGTCEGREVPSWEVCQEVPSRWWGRIQNKILIQIRVKSMQLCSSFNSLTSNPFSNSETKSLKNESVGWMPYKHKLSQVSISGAEWRP